MKTPAQLTSIAALSLLALLLAPSIARAQDPTKVDAKHYKVESENDKVRVLRIHYGPHEKSVMHEHPAGQVVYLSDSNMKFTTPDGKSQVLQGKAGQTAWLEAGKHLPENLSDKPTDAILIEIKGHPAPPPAKAAPGKK